MSVPPPGEKIAAASCVDDAGHLFRSKLIDACASVERWAAEILATDRARAVVGGEQQHLSGHKLQAVRKLAEADATKRGSDRVLAHPRRVIDLLDEFRRYTELKSVLGHATLTAAVSARGHLFIYERVSGSCWEAILTEEDFRPIINACNSLAKRFNDQRLNATR